MGAALRKSRPKADARMHIHIENNAHLGQVFDMTPQLLRQALKRHPRAAKEFRFTIGYDGESLDRNLKTADALIGWDFPRQDFATRAPRLRWFHAIGAGINQYFPLDWLPKNVIFSNNRGVHGLRAAEYAITAVMMLNNRLPEMVTHQRAGRWQQCFNTAVKGKTLLIVGVGNVGGDTARFAKMFGMHVIGIRRSGKAKPKVDEMHKPGALRRLLPRADFVIVCAPDTPGSHHMIGKREIALMKPGSGLVNYSRAGLVDYDALRKRLNGKGDIGAILDVFTPEPLPGSSPLWKTRNLIITPHSSSDDPVTYVPLTFDLVLENALRLAGGKPLLKVVDRALGY